jgi:hypothetical protein
VALGAVATAFASCSQAAVDCQIANAGSGYSYIAKYKLNGTPAAGCEKYVIKGEALGIEMYHPPTADGTTYDPSQTTIAIQSEALENEVQSDGMNNVGSGGAGGGSSSPYHPYARGKFTTAQPVKDMCVIPTFTASADMQFPLIPGTGGAGGTGPGVTPTIPAEEIKYEWKNLNVYVTAAAQGTQFTADLTYTHIDTASSTTCTFDYHVVAMWPAVGCAAADGTPDDTLCSPCSNPDAGRSTGAPISPDFATKCDPDLLYCVLVDAKDKSDPTTVPQVLSTSVDCGTIQ